MVSRPSSIGGPLETLRVRGTLGLLHTEYIDYLYGDRNLDGRDQAHAPSWQYSLAWNGSDRAGLMVRADMTGSDAFYFDASHDQRSEPEPSSISRRAGRGPAGRPTSGAATSFDENYAVRGFYFGLEPPEFANKLYVQRGDPRQFGVTVEWRLR